MPNRDDENDPQRNNPQNDGYPEGASENLKAYIRRSRREEKQKADRAKYRSDAETIRAQQDFHDELVRIGERMLKEAYVQTYTIRPTKPSSLAYLGLEETPAKGRRSNRRVDQDLVQFFRNTTASELARKDPDWTVIRSAFFGLASVFHKGCDHGSAEYALLQGVQLMQQRHGEHSKPAISFTAKAYHWLFKHGMHEGALRFAEKLHFILQGHLPPNDPRLSVAWLHMAQCQMLNKNFKRSIALAWESWNASLGWKGRAPRLFPLLCIARMHLACGDFSKCAQVAGLIIKIAKAYRMEGTEHHLDAQALLSETRVTR